MSARPAVIASATAFNPTTSKAREAPSPPAFSASRDPGLSPRSGGMTARSPRMLTRRLPPQLAA